MQVKLKRIDPIQAGKMLAALYGILSLLFIPFMIFFMTVGSFAARQQGGPEEPARQADVPGVAHDEGAPNPASSSTCRPSPRTRSIHCCASSA